ncbi:MAG: acetyl-CoA carboxylase carboxyltransferase subunit alpha [Halanaerobiaceae bacterium]
MSDKMLDFEKPLIELKQKINELQSFMKEKDIDLTDEIKTLKNRARNLRKEIYNNLEAWQILQIARHPERPLTYDYINFMCEDFIEFHGDRRYGDDKALIGGIGLIEEQPVTILGHQKGKSTKENLDKNFGMAHPEGYRKALRLMKQAEKFNRPVINLINTPGAYPGIGAEKRGQAEAIAYNLQEMSSLKVPMVVVIIGEGGSGGALGIGLGDEIMMLEYSYYSVSSPEACAAILWKDSDKASDAAESLNLTASDLLDLGVIDKIIKEPPGGAHKDPEEAGDILKKEILNVIDKLFNFSKQELINRRYEKFRKMGKFTQKSSKSTKLNNVKTS